MVYHLLLAQVNVVSSCCSSSICLMRCDGWPGCVCATFNFHSVWSKSIKLYPIGNRLPFEVVQGVSIRDFDPPVTPLHSLLDKSGVVSCNHNVLVTVLYIGVRKWYFGCSFLRSTPSKLLR